MTIAIVDDHPLIQEGFKNAVLDAYPQAEVHTAMDERELFALLIKTPVDILFLDIRLGKSDARNFMKELRTEFPQLKIIIISSLDDPETINTLIDQGAGGYLLKSDPKSEIHRAIETVISENKIFLSEGIQSNYGARPASNSTKLTPREEEILSLILKGKTTKQIAKSLFISEKTVENHRTNIFVKFEVKNVASLVRKAILQGFL